MARSGNLTTNAVLKLVAEKFGVTAENLVAKGGNKRTEMIRDIAIMLVYELTDSN